MHPLKPGLDHPPEVHEAILRECGRDPVRISEHLQACDWTLRDAAWAAVNWDVATLAAALAEERTKRCVSLTNSSEAELAKIRQELAEARNLTTITRPPKTIRIVRPAVSSRKASCEPKG